MHFTSPFQSCAQSWYENLGHASPPCFVDVISLHGSPYRVQEPKRRVELLPALSLPRPPFTFHIVFQCVSVAPAA